ncbi:uncharacterized protein MELLADRAFT_102287 [Melampsora larici-populina 98AG31]|uniref:Uncharacterized protein n=1 Tax=Melampsora larici-populina (strain 98AG31 / pathotype 3-4-7) TaxID=747676 RepID=F4R7T1_MELLP|nr:uncharacterized protein MELLADRAFT_102287 [Melampsora larici-populina 98AG31]EGG11731.1 hypothetical protein MELLADRAFT_102287 [Melampsora larici-populina 98AG31]
MTTEANIKMCSLMSPTDMNPNFVFPAIESRKPTQASSHQRASLPAIARRLSASIVSTPAKALDKVEQNLKQVKEIVDPRRPADIQNTPKHRRFASGSILASSTPNVRASINRRFSRQQHQRSECNDGILKSFVVLTPVPSSPKFLGRGLYANIPTNSDGFSGDLPDFKSHTVLRKPSGQFNYPVHCTPIPSSEATPIPGASISKPPLPPKSLELQPKITPVQPPENVELKIENLQIEPLGSRKVTPSPPIKTRSVSPSSVNDQEESYQPLRYRPPGARRPDLILKVSSFRPHTAQGILERMNGNQGKDDRKRLSTVSSVYSSDWREDIMSEYEDQNETSSIPSSGSIFPSSSSHCVPDQIDSIYEIDESVEKKKQKELMNSLELELGEIYHLKEVTD